ncbi:MAG: CpXC domain-containing protein [Kofleriaceae bacterium]
MSTWTTRSLACPRCGVLASVRIAAGVHVARAPEVREQILAGQLHRFTCSGCDESTQVEAAFVYTDFPRHHWISVATPDELASWRDHEARLAGEVARAFELGSPLAHPLADGLRVRLVFGSVELREKLVVWGAGIDDALVECVKVRAFASDPELAAPGSRLLVETVAADGLVLAWFAGAADRTPARRVEVPGAWLADTDRDRASLAARFPELFGSGFVSVARLVN